MSTLRPLIDSSSSQHARRLLRAARADGPRPGAAGRTLSALGVVGATAKVALAASSAAAPAATGLSVSGGAVSLPLIAAKWLLVGMLGGGALASGAARVFSEPQPNATAPAAQPRPSAAAAASNDSAPTPAPADATEATPEPAANTALRVTPAAAASVNDQALTVPFTAPSQAAFASPERSKVLHDIALLDDARRALRSGDATGTRSALARYDRERETHVLEREAQVLRERLQTLVNDGK